MTAALFAIGLGTGTRGARGNWLEVFYPAPQRNADAAVAAALAAHCGYAGGNAVLEPSPQQLAASARHSRPPATRRRPRSPGSSPAAGAQP